MTDDDRGLLQGLLGSLNPIPTQDDIWRGSPYDVPELHLDVTRKVVVEIDSMKATDAGQPLGVAVLGSSGAGKTHLLGAVRRQIHEKLGYFFLVTLNSGRSFWTSTALAISAGFRHQSSAWGTQHRTFARRLGAMLQLQQDVRDAIAGDATLTPTSLKAFATALRANFPEVDRGCEQTARALVLLGSKNFEEQDIGEMFFQSELLDQAALDKWGLPPTPRTPQEIVRDTSRLIALTRSPTLIAFDQVDLLIEKFAGKPISIGAPDADGTQEVVSLTQGLVDLLDRTQRTLVVLTCTPTTWTLISQAASQPFITRFRKEGMVGQITDPNIARDIIARRFAPSFEKYGPKIDNPTWPVTPEAFAGIESISPRDLITRVQAHLRACMLDDQVRVLADVMSGATKPWRSTSILTEPDFDELDRDFAQFVAGADVAAALDGRTEDGALRELLGAGIAAWINEQSSGTFICETPEGDSCALHATLVQILDPVTERQATWSFRGIASAHPVAVISRVRKAKDKSGLGSGLADRHLYLLRRDAWPTGKRTEEVTADVAAAGAVLLRDFERDLKVFAALKDMQEKNKPGLARWLAERRHASRSSILRAVAPITVGEAPIASPASASAEQPKASNQGDGHDHAAMIELGRLATSGDAFTFPLASLTRHMVIFAGSGSGKTVLIKRVVEECALRGVSAIVLDVNNDMARLGDAWEEPPAAGWQAGDHARATEYLANTEVMVWTPRVGAGRPLSFRPLPDFSAVLDDEDEFALAVGSAVDALAPRVGAFGDAEKSKKRRAVLTKAMEAFARSEMTGLAGFRKFLAQLPDGVSEIGAGQKIAAELADLLQAEMDIDPLLRDEQAIADPGVLLTPTMGKRARVSVISFIGLTVDQRQGFVGQMQLALFNWVKQHPAAPGSLGWLLVIDEAQNYAPATGVTPSTSSTILLAQQARKYGLGLVLATQPPKGIHNQIVGNALTQVVGLLNAGSHIQSARELADAKGAKLPDVGTLKSGEFYVANENESFTRVNTPLCLSFHGGALTREEVLERAKRDP